MLNTLILTRTDALEYFRSKQHYYNKRTKLYYCQGDNCGRMLTDKQVIDDHIDNDNTNNKPGNHQPLCKSCNTHNSGKPMEQQRKILKKRRKAFDSGLNKSSSISAQININRVAEPAFRQWVLKQVEIYGSISWIDLVDGGSEYVSQNHIPLSQSTAARYLGKMVSIAGPLLAIGTGDTRQIELRNKNKSSENVTGPS